MAPTGRRGMLPPGGEGPGQAMKYVGMAAAALGAITGGFNLYEKHKDQFISGPPRNMPRMIERQILAARSSPDDDDEYATTSHAVIARSGEDFSTDHLRFLQEEYKEELNESKDEGDWEACACIFIFLLLCRT